MTVLEQELTTERDKVASLEAEVSELRQEQKRQAARLAMIRENFPEVYAGCTFGHGDPVPDIPAGKVAAIRTAPASGSGPRLVMLTVGQEHGVQKGMVFIIYRENKYICKVKAEKIMPKMTACLTIEDSWNDKGLAIEEGDMAQVRVW